MGGEEQLHKQGDRGGFLQAFELGLLVSLPSCVLPQVSVWNLTGPPFQVSTPGRTWRLRKEEREEDTLKTDLLPEALKNVSHLEAWEPPLSREIWGCVNGEKAMGSLVGQGTEPFWGDFILPSSPLPDPPHSVYKPLRDTACLLGDTQFRHSSIKALSSLLPIPAAIWSCWGWWKPFPYWNRQNSGPLCSWCPRELTKSFQDCPLMPAHRSPGRRAQQMCSYLFYFDGVFLFCISETFIKNS